MSNSTNCIFKINITIGIAILLVFSGSANAANLIWDEASGSTLPFTWDYKNFDGFNISGLGTESLAVVQTGLSGSSRIIKSGNDPMGSGLFYNTTRVPVNFKVFEYENLTVATNNNYFIVLMNGEKWVAIKGLTNKMAKLVLEMGNEERKTMATGETWSLGGGYELKINAIDARTSPRQVWFTLKKNGVIVDEGIGQEPSGSLAAQKQNAVYYKTKTMIGEMDALLFTVYIENIFSGSASDMVQFKYAWLIDESTTHEIQLAERFGVFEVRAANSQSINLSNVETLTLASNTTIGLNGNVKFKVLDNVTFLKFYPVVAERLNITASPDRVPVGIQTDVTFTVSSNGIAVGSAIVNLSGAAIGTGITDAGGHITIRVNNSYKGTIIAEASKEGYSKGNFYIQPYLIPSSAIASWDLQENYVLNLTGIDDRSYQKKAYLQLIKNGNVIEESIISEGNNFSYCPINCTFNVTLDLIFNGTQGRLIRLSNASQKSEINGTPLQINSTYLMTTANFSGISWALYEGYDLRMMDIDSRAYPRRIWLELLKNSAIKEDIFLAEGQTFNYTNNSKLLEGKVDSIFTGLQGNFVKLTKVTQFSETNGMPLLNNITQTYKYSTVSGISWHLYEGYNLTMMDINAEATPHLVWLELSKNNTILDDSIVYSPHYYNYSSGSVILNSKIDGIFNNLYSSVVVLKEVDLSENGAVLLNKSFHSFISGAINRSDYSLDEGYNLSLLGAEATYSPRQAWIRIYKDDNQKDEKIVSYNDKYIYYNLSGNIVLYAEVDNIFSGASQDFVQFRNITQYSELDGRELINVPKITIVTNYSQSSGPTPTPTTVPATTPSPAGNIACEIRGTVFHDHSSIPAWDANNFAGFYYDLNNNRSTESLKFIQPLGAYAMTRSMGQNQLEYTTTKAWVQFKANEKEGVEIMNISGTGVTNYQLVGWQAEKWIAINGKANKLAKLAFEMGAEDKKTLTTGETWTIGSGYELTINAIDARTTPRQVWFTLKNNGTVIDEGLGQAPQSSSIAYKNKAVYSKTKTVLGEINSLLFTIYVDTVFSGATSDMVQFKYAWLIDENSAEEINVADRVGVFEVKEARSDYIRLMNVDPVNLSMNSETTLMGNMKFRIADNSSGIRLYPFVEHTIPGLYEIRGQAADSTVTPSWDAQTFAGFYYDIDDDVGSERLTFLSPVNNRNIPDNGIIYSTSPQEVSFVYSNFGKYQVIGFMAEKYFAGYNSNTNSANTRPTTDFSGISALAQGQLHKVLMDDNTKRTLSVGGTVALQEGYVLLLKGIDLNARTILLSLLKDGTEVDISPLSADETYVYSKTVGGVEALPLIIVRFENVFSGQGLQVAFLKGIFQISENPIDITTGNRFDIMEVTSVSSNSIELRNNGSIGLSKNTETTLMGNIKFKVADNDILRFYPKIDFYITYTNQLLHTPYVFINQGDIYTNSTSVGLTLLGTGALEMSLKNESSNWTQWGPFKNIKSWVLSGGDGLKTVYFKTRIGTIESSAVSDNITLDSTKPIVLELNTSASTLLLNQSVNISVKVNDNISLDRVNILITHPSKLIETFQMNNTNSSRFYMNFNNTTEYGRYNITILASDSAGNINNTEKTWFVTTMPPYVNNSVNTTANNVTQIDAREKANTTLDLFTSNDTTGGTIKITLSNSIPPEINQTFSLIPLGKYIKINASRDLENNLTSSGWIIIKLYYTSAELNGLDEGTLKLSWYNETSGSWQNLVSGSPAWVHAAGVATADINGYAGYVWANISHLSTFGVVGSYPVPSQTVSSGGGSGGGGGGGGASGENYTNIEVIEKYDMQISKDALTSYRFTHSKNPVMFVNITGNTSIGIITASIEVLKNTSTLVKIAPEGLVYKNTNIWVGTSGYATPKNIKMARIKFRVDNEWMNSNSISRSDIALVKWDGSQWIKLETSESAKDDTDTYFEAKTQTFSSFAIIGLKEEKSGPIYADAVTATPAKPISTPTKIPTKGMSGFEIATAIGVICVIYMQRKTS
ncbi:MAG: S-layer protein domain-containing protein [Candidatus Methanoperedens sp.]|nr:S-layer protein domain-containing protein [Candidatus Methanoperedens sp.]